MLMIILDIYEKWCTKNKQTNKQINKTKERLALQSFKTWPSWLQSLVVLV